MLVKVLKYQVLDLIRSRWFFVQFIFFVFSSYLLFSLSGSVEKALVGFVVLSILLLPLFVLIVSVLYFYGNRSFIELILTLPVSRSTIYISTFLSLSLSCFLSYITGVFLPIFYMVGFEFATIKVVLFTSSVIFPFAGLGVLIPVSLDDRLKGTAVSLFVWLFFAVLYDAILLYLLAILSVYPIEHLFIFLTLINPLDTIRVVLLLNLGLNEFLGFAGEFFSNFSSFSSWLLPILSCCFYTLLFLILGINIFSRKDF